MPCARARGMPGRAWRAGGRAERDATRRGAHVQVGVASRPPRARRFRTPPSASRQRRVRHVETPVQRPRHVLAGTFGRPLAAIADATHRDVRWDGRPASPHGRPRSRRSLAPRRRRRRRCGVRVGAADRRLFKPLAHMAPEPAGPSSPATALLARSGAPLPTSAGAFSCLAHLVPCAPRRRSECR